jgi:probable F420-dependent oxidoreductase
MLEVGVAIPHIGPIASPGFVGTFCKLAEEAGFSGLWAAEHLAVPQNISSSYTLTRQPSAVSGTELQTAMGLNLEMITTLATAAALTKTVRIGTAVAVLPLRNPLLNARQLASLDLYSGGRLMYGVGVGWLKEEADALAMPWGRRGLRSDEHIEVLRKVWSSAEDTVSFSGEFYSFQSLYADPRPGRHIPILIGGHSRAAVERTARIGDGWIAAMGPERFAAATKDLGTACRRHGRDIGDLWLMCTSMLEASTNADTEMVLKQLDSYAAGGAQHIQVRTDTTSERAALEGLSHWGERVLPELATRADPGPRGHQRGNS